MQVEAEQLKHTLKTNHTVIGQSQICQKIMYSKYQTSTKK